jgi:DNA-directed RNA polymerase subunit K/omega
MSVPHNRSQPTAKEYPMELHFETIMRAAEQQLGNEAHQLVDTDPKTAAKLVEIAIEKIADSYTTAQKLTILAGVRDIDDHDVGNAALSPVRKMSEAATVMLKSCIRERLGMMASAINIAVFGRGVLRAADAFIKVAEAAKHSENWLPGNKVVAIRDAYGRLYAGEGNQDDLRTVLNGAALFKRITDNDRSGKLYTEHRLEPQSINEVAKELKFYRDLLRPGWPLLEQAFDQLIDEQRRDVGLPPVQKAAPGPR